jgi:hypothetical protein
MPAVESRDALLDKPLAPTGHKPPAAIDALGHFIPSVAFRKQQDQPRPSGIFGPIRPAMGPSRQFQKLRIRQSNRVSHERDFNL